MCQVKSAEAEFGFCLSPLKLTWTRSQWPRSPTPSRQGTIKRRRWRTSFSQQGYLLRMKSTITWQTSVQSAPWVGRSHQRIIFRALIYKLNACNVSLMTHDHVLWGVRISILFLGLGSLYGDHDLKDNMDRQSEMRIIENTLWKHFERFMWATF